MQIFFDGSINGISLAVLALSFAIVYLPTRIFHISLAGIYTLAPYIAWTCLQKGYSWPIAAGCSIAAGITLSLACEILNHQFLEKKKASSESHLVSSLGIFITILQVISLIWGNAPKVLRTGLDSSYRLGTYVLTNAQLVEVSACLLLLTGFFVWLKFSNHGLQLRALADNPTELALRGYNIRFLRLVSFFISGLLCSSVSLLVAYDLGFDPNGGLSMMLLSVVATIVGGRNTYLGPVLGGLCIGLLRMEVTWFIAARWKEMMTLLLLAFFLFFRPQGIVIKKARLEADL